MHALASLHGIKQHCGTPRAQGSYAKRAGEAIVAVNRSSGKSFGLRVTWISALPCSAQTQNGSSLGSGEISIDERTLTSSDRSRIRLMTFPIRWERTRSRFKTSLYSSRMSSVISQTKWFFSAHLWGTSALGFRPGTKDSRKPDMPATRLVSTTTRGLPPLAFGGNGDLRGTPVSAATAYCAQNFFFGDLSDVLRRLCK